MLEMQNLLTISTAHITEQTASLLDADPEQNCLGLCVYSKANYGWFIMGIQNINQFTNCDELPEDLMNVILFAKDMNADILSIDCDGEILPYLKTYNW